MKILQTFQTALTKPQDLSKPEAKQLKNVSRIAELAALALVVATVAAGLFSGPIGLFVAAVAAVALWDLHVMSHNIGVIAAKAEGEENNMRNLDEVIGGLNDVIFGVSLDFTKNTLLTGRILHLIAKW